MKSIIDYLMEKPIFYRLVQSTLAGGGHEVIKRYLSGQLPKRSGKVLDQGCGTGEYSLLCRGEYTGLDNNSEDIVFAQKNYRGKFITGSADRMPFKDNSFNMVFSVGLYHHLTDTQAKRAIAEAIRVTKKGGKIIIVDAMLPKNKLNFLGLVLRKMDRGKYVRDYSQTIRLVPKNYTPGYHILSKFPFDYIIVEIIRR